MKRYSIVHPFLLSFFSKDLYSDVAHNWKGSAFLYLGLLLIVCWIPNAIKITMGVSKLSAQAPQLLEQIPDITIAKGEVSVNAPMPLSIKNPKTGETIAIIDTTGQTTSLANTSAGFLLTKHSLILRDRPDSASERVYDLSTVKEFSLTKDRMARWVDLAGTLLPVVIIPVVLVGSYAYRLVQALIYAAIGLIFNSALKAGLKYPALIRLSFIAVTPVVILDTIRDLAGVAIPYWAFICLLIAMAYLFFGVRSSNVSQKTSPEVLETV
jgi:hypothetical protein